MPPTLHFLMGEKNVAVIDHWSRFSLIRLIGLFPYQHTIPRQRRPTRPFHSPTQGFLCQLSACLMIIICAPFVQTPIRSSDSIGQPSWNPNFLYPKHENLAWLCCSTCRSPRMGEDGSKPCEAPPARLVFTRYTHCRCVRHSNITLVVSRSATTSKLCGLIGVTKQTSAEDLCYLSISQEQRDRPQSGLQVGALLWAASSSWRPSCHTPSADVLIDETKTGGPRAI